MVASEATTSGSGVVASTRDSKKRPSDRINMPSVEGTREPIRSGQGAAQDGDRAMTSGWVMRITPASAGVSPRPRMR